MLPVRSTGAETQHSITFVQMSDLHKDISYIAIEGNIGAGKSTLTELLCNDIKARGLYEQFADNPYLPEFYKNPEKNAFPLEVSFLAERFRQMKEMFEKSDIFHPVIISDFVFQKSLIFARFTLAEAEFQVFEKVFQLLNQAAHKPDVIVYLHREIPSLTANIHKRGRSYEQDISAEYLDKVTKSYFKYFKELHDIPVVIVDADKHDFLVNSNERKELLRYLKPLNLRLGLNFFGR